MKLLKTNFYSPNEVPFLLLNLQECYEHVDKFIAYEFNYTKSGLKKDFVDLSKQWHLFEPYEDKFEYHKINLDDDSVYIRDDFGICERIQKTINEPYSRNYFTKLVSLDDEDYVFSVDADEVVYSEAYDAICQLIDEKDSPVILRMYFFWRKINFLTNKDWRSPCACKFKHLKDKTQMCSFGETKYPQWRDEGIATNFYSGCHFSNCYQDDEQFEYRKKAIYYKPTDYSGKLIEMDDAIMPKFMKQVSDYKKEIKT
jgi:hypothetical protein